jgi:plastocyanin
LELRRGGACSDPTHEEDHPMKTWQAAIAALSLSFAMTAAQAQDVVVSLVARDGKFEPATLEVPAGKRIRIEVSNQGRKPIEFESKALKFEKVLAPGAKSSVVVNPLKPGEYPFFDEFSPDAKGTVVAR